MIPNAGRPPTAASVFRVEHVHDRVEPLPELRVPAFDLVEVVRRERVDQVPDGRPREAVHLSDAEPCRRPRGIGESLGRSTANALRVAVAPDLGGKDRMVPLVDSVADRLPHEMGAERPHTETVAIEQPAEAGDVAVVGECLVDVEVIAPAGELEALIAPVSCSRGNILQG